jgi:hypothetical protein
VQVHGGTCTAESPNHGQIERIQDAARAYPGA